MLHLLIIFVFSVWEMQKSKFASFLFVQHMQRLENSIYLENTEVAVPISN